MESINCKGTLVDLSSPKVMGVLNISPDSFFDGGNYSKPAQIVSQVNKMLSEGATFIDIGAFSSRPGAQYISEKEELDRILPVLKILLNEFAFLQVKEVTKFGAFLDWGLEKDLLKCCLQLEQSL